jgi:hypothetical protein
VAKKPKIDQGLLEASVNISDTPAPEVAGKKATRRKSISPKRPASSPRKKLSVEASKTKESRPRPPLDPSDEEIRMRAYFISERRHRLGLPGDSNSDWLDAKRQLLSELGPR